MALGSLLEAFGAEKSSVEASWRRLGALKVAPWRHGTDREGGGGEVKERSGEQVWLAPARGERHYQRLSIKNNPTHPAMRDLTRPGPKARRFFKLQT